MIQQWQSVFAAHSLYLKLDFSETGGEISDQVEENHSTQVKCTVMSTDSIFLWKENDEASFVKVKLHMSHHFSFDLNIWFGLKVIQISAASLF